MIMTKDKARELSKMAAGRLGGSELVMADGAYTLTSTRDTEDVVRSVESGEADYVMMGMVVPADKAASLCRLIEDEAGLLPSPVILMKRENDSAVGARLPYAAARPSSPEKSTPSSSPGAITIKNIEIIPGRHEVKVSGKLVVLTFSEFRILQTLASKPGWVFSREQIIQAVHGENYSCTERAVDVQVTGLRKKLGTSGAFVETVRGVGYRFSE